MIRNRKKVQKNQKGHWAGQSHGTDRAYAATAGTVGKVLQCTQKVCSQGHLCPSNECECVGS